MRYCIVETAWGAFGFVTRNARLVATFLPRSVQQVRQAIRRAWPEAVEDGRLLPRFRRQVIEYFEGKPVRFEVRLDLSDVPPFRRAVLEACHRIPHGDTVSYGDLACAVGKPGASRAVGGAMAHNPVPLVVPCHRVLRSDGSIGGFSTPRGVKEKERLLRLEGASAVHGSTTKSPDSPRRPRSRLAGAARRKAPAVVGGR
jgi:methylated-DNA-[protein]-cysteine S-methyltransferase